MHIKRCCCLRKPHSMESPSALRLRPRPLSQEVAACCCSSDRNQMAPASSVWAGSLKSFWLHGLSMPTPFQPDPECILHFICGMSEGGSLLSQE